MDRGVIPKSLWTSAEDVVDASLRGLERDKLIVVPGWRYRMLLPAIRVLPQSFVRFLEIKYSNSSWKLTRAKNNQPRVNTH